MPRIIERRKSKFEESLDIIKNETKNFDKVELKRFFKKLNQICVIYFKGNFRNRPQPEQLIKFAKRNPRIDIIYKFLSNL